MVAKTGFPSTHANPRIFLSYARKDGEDFARDLRHKLTDHGFSLWQDRTQMEGGKDWWDQILDALKHVEYMVLVMTQASLASPIVRKEWRQARQEGVGVIPVFGQSDLDLSQLPRWMRDVHWVNTEVSEQWTRFIRTLENPHQGTRVPFMADELPIGFVPRIKEFEELAESLLDPEQEEPVAITAALKGAGGYGKTTLAKALCHDERIQDAFHDGILWVTLGEQPNTMAGLTKLYAALTAERPNFVDEEDASARLAEVLGDKDCLIVIDDVWNAAHLRPFMRGGKRCARIITTRDSTTLPETAKLRVPVDAMQQKEALELLSYDLPKSETADLRALAARLGEWPFLLKLANGTLRERVNTMGQSLEDALAYVQKALKKRGLTAFDARNPVERHQAVAITLGASFEHLKEDELARYQELAIFPEDEEVPLTAVTKLWLATGGLDDFDTEELCTRLNQLSLLLRYDPTTQCIQLHDVVRTYLEEQVASQLPALHGQFLDVFGLQNELAKAARDPYLCRYLAYHLVKAERWEELKNLLLNVDWLYAKLEAVDVPALLSDFEWMQEDKALVLVQGAIRLSAHIVGKFRSQLIGQLLGRLQTFELPEIKTLLDQARSWRKKPWIRPLQGSLIAPGGPLIRTLSGHSGPVRDMTVMPDGTRLISASQDQTCIVWDLAKGEAVWTLRGHNGGVTAVTVTLDGKQAILGAHDGSCSVWDLDTGKEVLTLCGHTKVVNIVTLTPDGTKAISGSSDTKVKVWDLATGQEVHTLNGHNHPVWRVVVTPDGTRAISSAGDLSCVVWDLANGQKLHTFKPIFSGDRPSVIRVVVTPNGLRAISWGAHDGSCSVWDLDSSQELYTFRGHQRPVYVVAVTPDGRWAISGAHDGSCSVWDLDSGQELYTFRGHQRPVYVITVTPDGLRAILAAQDGSCIVWDLTREEIYPLGRHGVIVTAIAVTPDGRQVISGGKNGTCEVWDLARVGEISSHGGHNGDVTAVAVTPDGKQVISASLDQTCVVWDLTSGRKLHIFSQHTRRVNAVAVTPDGRRVISVADDYTCRVWDLAGAKELYLLIEHNDVVRLLAVSPDGSLAISGSYDGTCKVWDLASGQVIQTFGWYDRPVTVVAVSTDCQRVIAAAEDSRCIVWDLTKGEEMYELGGTSDIVIAVAVTPDGQRAILGASNGNCSVWDLSRGKEIHSLGRHDDMVTVVAVASDGTRAISASKDGTCIVWDLASGEALHTLVGHSGGVHAMAVTPNSTRAISGAHDCLCKVWDLESGKEVATFTGESPILCCAVSPDGRTIVVGESSGRVHVLRLEGVD